jgi:hypothetical protein
MKELLSFLSNEVQMKILLIFFGLLFIYDLLKIIERAFFGGLFDRIEAQKAIGDSISESWKMTNQNNETK